MNVIGGGRRLNQVHLLSLLLPFHRVRANLEEEAAKNSES